MGRSINFILDDKKYIIDWLWSANDKAKQS